MAVTFTFYQNGFSGSIAASICDTRTPPSGTGDLANLIGLTCDATDSDNDTFGFTCACCSACMPSSG